MTQWSRPLCARFMDVTLPIFRRLGINVVSVFKPQDSAGGLWYVVAFRDEADRVAAWAAFGADAHWKPQKSARTRALAQKRKVAV